MVDLKTLVNEILEQSYIMHLSVNDEIGPWCAQLIFVHDEDYTLYWKSEISSRHSRAILSNSIVACSISPSQGPEDIQRGLQILGRAKKWNGELSLADVYQRKRGKISPHKLGETQSWYYLMPIEVELTYEPIFDYRKQKVLL